MAARPASAGQRIVDPCKGWRSEARRARQRGSTNKAVEPLRGRMEKLAGTLNRVSQVFRELI